MAFIAGFSNHHDWLPRGLGVLLRALHNTGNVSENICTSFQMAARGVRAARAGVFLLRNKHGELRLETLCSIGFTEQQLRNIETGKEPELAKTRCVWEMAVQSEPGTTGTDWISRSQTENCVKKGVICLPIVDRILNAFVAVMYIERDDDGVGFGIQEVEWIDNYRLALGEVLRFGIQYCSHELATGAHLAKVRAVKSAPALVGNSLQIQALRCDLHEVHIPAASAPDPDPILVLGEKGTGKDLIARYIYSYSARSNHPYVAVNCAEITDELASARFFGHKRGAFTGSLSSEPGLFRAADHGVLFLDEIGDLSLRAQATLLRVLENRTVVPLGETKEIRVDVQVILATNCNTERAVAQGQIRADLLDRFNTQKITLHPLRERPWDIPALAHHFVLYHEKRTQKRTCGLHPDVLKVMVGYAWPGNVRELARVCSLLVTHAQPAAHIDMVLFNRLLPSIAHSERNPMAAAVLQDDMPMRDVMEIFGRELILSRLKKHNWNVRLARESLRLPKTTFHRYARSFGIAPIPANETNQTDLGVAPTAGAVNGPLLSAAETPSA